MARLKLRSTTGRLYTIGALACGGLLLEAQLPIAPYTHRLLLVGWVIAVFGALSDWVNNSYTRETAPRPRMLGRDLPPMPDFYGQAPALNSPYVVHWNTLDAADPCREAISSQAPEQPASSGQHFPE